MTDIRLDPADLRAAARIIRDACDRGGPPDDDTALADRLDSAAEAASRPPALSDWVRACEVSRLGAPKWSILLGAKMPLICHLGSGDARGIVQFSMPPDAGFVYDNSPRGLSGPVSCSTPAALTAALDALCEVPRG